MPLPLGARASLVKTLSAYRAAHQDVRWVGQDAWHLTSLFLGSVPASCVAGLVEAMDEVAAVRGSHVLGVDGADGRLQRGKGVAWLTIGQGAAMMDELSSALQRRISTAIDGIPAPARSPSAHLTVARKADAEVISALRQQRYGAIELAWAADRISLVRSFLGPSGSRYETLHEARCTLPGTTSRFDQKSVGPSTVRR